MSCLGYLPSVPSDATLQMSRWTVFNALLSSDYSAPCPFSPHGSKPSRQSGTKREIGDIPVRNAPWRKIDPYQPISSHRLTAGDNAM